MNRIAVIKAVFSGYDAVSPVCFESDYDFLLFTDSNIKIKGWDTIYLSDNRRPEILNRIIKSMQHKCLFDYDVIIYLDGNIDFTSNGLSIILNEFNDTNNAIMVARHFARKSIYDEAEVLLRSIRVKSAKLFLQMYKYIKLGYRDQLDMGENNIIVYRPELAKSAFDKWYFEYCNCSNRDQVSLAPICYFEDTQYGILSFGSRQNSEFHYRPHVTLGKAGVKYSLVKFFKYIGFSLPFKLLRIWYRV